VSLELGMAPAIETFWSHTGGKKSICVSINKLIVGSEFALRLCKCRAGDGNVFPRRYWPKYRITCRGIYFGNMAGFGGL
jgi:hypothetical protein